jgi:putative methyltransferase (TIGR04325 family)
MNRLLDGGVGAAKRLRGRFSWPSMDGVLRRSITPLLPKLVLDIARQASSDFSYEPLGWAALSQRGTQHRNSECGVSTPQEKQWPLIVGNIKGTGPLGVSHLSSHSGRENFGAHNTMMSYGYVLARAARNKQSLRILDWGSSLGHYYLYSKALLPELTLDYHCYEVPRLCRAGQRLLPEVHFHEGADRLAGTQFDLVISSSSLHYFEDWRDIAGVLAARTGGFLYVARLMTVNRVPSFVVRQSLRRLGYEDVLGWFLNREEMLARFDQLGMELVREFIYPEDWRVKHAPERGQCRGFLFRPRRGVIEEKL